MIIDQKLYLPSDSTLLEVIAFPKILQKMTEHEVQSIRENVLWLFKKLQIDEFTKEQNSTVGLSVSLDSKEFLLSGGQEKKIGLIQAILSQPDILFFDEIFANLDKASVIEMEACIQKYLPNATLFIVDHHADDNNYYGFYDQILHVRDRSLHLRVPESKEIEEYLKPELEQFILEIFGLNSFLD